ncbi:uncharacterized protein C8orf59 homolog isoform X3 [Myotis lucifugus]|uniref:uncharacterized protein C8orf59 homolog isoform X3 n=2 Tax=Myotis lucifugus TaxID=59463 RepID=UPI000CCC5239|nr:uncharacterized protein C8orf59 homolog isoform X3 [Myotis lucifugus]
MWRLLWARRCKCRKELDTYSGLPTAENLKVAEDMETMAKNKWKGQKPRNVFHVASQKHFKGKSKAKPVTTNLKKALQPSQEDRPVNVDEATRLMAQL